MKLSGGLLLVSLVAVAAKEGATSSSAPKQQLKRKLYAHPSYGSYEPICIEYEEVCSPVGDDDDGGKKGGKGKGGKKGDDDDDGYYGEDCEMVCIKYESDEPDYPAHPEYPPNYPEYPEYPPADDGCLEYEEVCTPVGDDDDDGGKKGGKGKGGKKGDDDDDGYYEEDCEMVCVKYGPVYPDYPVYPEYPSYGSGHRNLREPEQKQAS
jgi:hypothetical protein